MGCGCIVIAFSGIAYFSIDILESSIDSTLQIGRWFTLKLSMKCRLVRKVILHLPSHLVFSALFRQTECLSSWVELHAHCFWIIGVWFSYIHTQHLEFVNKAVLSSFSVQLLCPSHVRVSWVFPVCSQTNRFTNTNRSFTIHDDVNTSHTRTNHDATPNGYSPWYNIYTHELCGTAKLPTTHLCRITSLPWRSHYVYWVRTVFGFIVRFKLFSVLPSIYPGV